MTAAAERARLVEAIAAAVGTKHGDHARAAKSLKLAPSTLSRLVDPIGTTLPSEATAAKLDEKYGGRDPTFVTMTERCWIARRNERGGRTASVEGPFDEETSYETVALALRAFMSAATGDRSLRLMSAHGHTGDRNAVDPPDLLATSVFDDAIDAAIVARGKAAPRVRQLFTITDEGRLDAVLARLRTYGGARRYEVRAYVAVGSMPVLLPLIIGDEELFVGIDARDVYRIESAIRITGPEVVAWAIGYYDAVWDDAPFRLRRPAGLVAEDEAKIRAEIRRLNPSSASPTAAARSRTRQR